MSRRTEVGSWRHGRFGSGIANALVAAKRSPIAAMLIVAGAGWLIGAVSEKRMRTSSPRRYLRQARGRAYGIPVLNTGQSRLYDPDASSLHPTQDSLESRREMSARV
jgi:hypothetical protein